MKVERVKTGPRAGKRRLRAPGAGRPKADVRTVAIAGRLPEDQLAWLDEQAKARECGRWDVLRELIDSARGKK